MSFHINSKAPLIQKLLYQDESPTKFKFGVKDIVNSAIYENKNKVLGFYFLTSRNSKKIILILTIYRKSKKLRKLMRSTKLMCQVIHLQDVN